jgi:hypothetical protein
MQIGLGITATIAGSGAGGVAAGPAAPADYDIVAGSGDGEVDFIITTLGDGGDGAVLGDGLGEVTGHRWRMDANGTWATLAGATVPGTYTVELDLIYYGTEHTFYLQPLGYLGRLGAVVSALVTIPGTTFGIGTMEIGSTFEVA